MNPPSLPETTKQPSSLHTPLWQKLKPFVSMSNITALATAVTAIATVCIARNTSGWESTASQLTENLNLLTEKLEITTKNQDTIRSEITTQLNKKLDVTDLTETLSKIASSLTEENERITSTEEEPNQENPED